MVGEEGKLDASSKVTIDKAMVENEKRGLLIEKGTSSVSGDSHSREFYTLAFPSSTPQQGSAVPEVSHLGWGHWYTLRDLELATNFFADVNVLGEGGYGIVYRGQLPDGSFIAVKNLLNNRGQAEKEFRVEVEAIGRVRHKNLVRLIGYCAEGSHRMLVYEFVDNGNLDQWLHGKFGENNPIPWEGRMRIALGTAKGLAYLHEGLEPKVVHRDVKSSNILLDTEWNAKVSDFGLAKLLGAGKSFVTTRVMGTFGYVAPEYANTGLLNERSDVYSFGVLLMEVITGRDPVDYGRPHGEINLVDWLKMMVGSRRSEEVVDPRVGVKPSSRALKRALLVALRCVDPDAQKRPKMGHVVHMLEADDYPYRDVCNKFVCDRRGNGVARTRNSPHHVQQQPGGLQMMSPSPARKVGQALPSPAHKAEDNFELVLESPSGPGYKPSLRSVLDRSKTSAGEASAPNYIRL
ncbi:hypothetical protein GOP47_0024293 [Adiantum capillus-veneris]|uniref:non-specific serine/threonine protein kinase n=1 Tax=Adiantum capillus-veneris TaxID=13818 RepID=A0A9D4Z2N8_ADICA|nr:hypothetical protein GOP47_0024293 [Adiantum capillus-veneris]